MFTGLVEGIAQVETVSRIGQGLKIGLRPLFPLDDLTIGESIAVDGVCLTLVEYASGQIFMDVSHESLERSTLKYLTKGALVNIERSLKVGDRLGGHFVLGHVDSVGTILAVKLVERSHVMKIQMERSLRPYVVEKGSIAIDGISLTINACAPEWVETNIIPHTFEVTTLKYKRPGSKVNIEVDILGKYVYSILTHNTQKVVNMGEEITMEKLLEYGWR